VGDQGEADAPAAAVIATSGFVAEVPPRTTAADEAAVRPLADGLADGVRVGPDDVIDIGAVRDAAGHYRRATTTLRAFANLVLDELAARGVPIPPGAPKPAAEPAAEPDPRVVPRRDARVVTPLVARVLKRPRRVLLSDEAAFRFDRIDFKNPSPFRVARTPGDPLHATAPEEG
jgi:hypothetical protein